MVTAAIGVSAFEEWLDAVGIDVCDRDWADQAAALLGKTTRMVQYYRAGHEIPLTVLFLMEALAEGYRPRRYA